MKIFGRFPFAILTLVILAVISLLLIGNQTLFLSKPAWNITIATGTKGGTYYSLGKQFARLLSNQPEIQNSTSLETSASLENIQLLVDSQADIAFVFQPALNVTERENLARISVLARLCQDVVYIIVRKDAGIYSFSDLTGKKIYIGKFRSGTRFIAEALLSLMNVQPLKMIENLDFEAATENLIDGRIDAVILTSGKPNMAVVRALQSGQCALLDLSGCIENIITEIPHLKSEEIHANLYPNQPKTVMTISSDALLMCRSDLHKKAGFIILKTLFDNLDALLMSHTQAHDIRIEAAFQNLPSEVELHSGAIKFREWTQRELLIATGSYDGKYYDLGRRMQMLIEQRGIPTRVIHTDGTMENLQLLNEKPTLTIVQYDVALASYWDSPALFYDEITAESIQLSQVADMRRIATLHPENVHIIMRRDCLSPEHTEEYTVQALKDKRLCLGPVHGGTRVLAQTILNQHGIKPASITFLSVSDMVNRIQHGELSGGFFVSYTPSQAVKTLLADEEIVLLSIKPKNLVKLIGPALNVAKIPVGTYGCQLPGEPPIETLATRAILVTTEDLPHDVKVVTEAIFSGAAFLGIDAEDMATDLPSIPLHDGARKYYQKAGFLPSPHRLDYLERLWRLLACLVIIIGGYKGLLHLRREKAARNLRERIFDVSVSAGEPNSVEKLLGIRHSIHEVVRKKSWQRDYLDETRRKNLDNLVVERVRESKENLTKAFSAEIRSIKDFKGNKVLINKQFEKLEDRIWNSYANGELDESQQNFLIKILNEYRRHDDV